MAASVRLALHERLSSDPALAAAVDDGIFHENAPQDASHPLVVFHKQSGVPRWTAQGPPVEWELWTVRAVGRSSNETEPIAALIDARLNDCTLDVDGRACLYVRREADVSYPEVDGADIWRHLGGTYRVATG